MQDVVPGFSPGGFLDIITTPLHLKNPEDQIGLFRFQNLPNFILAPEVKFAFFSLTVGILGRIKSPFRRRQVPDHILKDLPRRLCIKIISGGLKSLRISDGQQGLVVEHFLKMRHQPVRIGAVAVETEPQMVIKAAPAHRLESFFHHLQRLFAAIPFPVTEKKEQMMGNGKFWRRTEPGIGFIEG